MSTLGELLGQLQDRSQVYQLLAEAGDVALIARLEEMADLSSGDPCDVAMQAVHAFTEEADDEAWLKLIGRIQDADAPAAVCLNEMISWSLAQRNFGREYSDESRT